jgi:hypothetical protein
MGDQDNRVSSTDWLIFVILIAFMWVLSTGINNLRWEVRDLQHRIAVLEQRK